MRFYSRREIVHILHLPLVERFRHRASRRVVIGVGSGICIMLMASTMAVNGHAVTFVPHALWDATAYFLHGVGGVPVIRYIEPFWMLILGEKKKED